MTVLGVIPARGGSKGIPRKNVRPIAGKPLIEWTIEAALALPRIAQVVVSTEDEEIAAVALAAGAAVPFLRPAHLAADDTPGIEPVLHALAELPSHDAVLLLQPTSPLRGASAIDELLDLAERSGAPSIVSVSEAPVHPAWMFTLDADRRLEPLSGAPAATRRQDLPPMFTLNGAIYYARTAWLQATRSFVGPETLGFVMTAEESVDIDDSLDWRFAELLLRERA